MLTYNYVKDQIESVPRYKLLSTEYINCETKLYIQCDRGHIFQMNWHCFQRGHRCLKCYHENNKLTYEYVKEQVENVPGWKLLSKEYKGNKYKLEIECNNSHVFWMEWSIFNQGHRCRKCWLESVTGKGNYGLFGKDNPMYGMVGNKNPNYGNGDKISGDKNPNWKGGIACEPYCDVWLDKEYKQSIMKRDDHECQNPDCWNTTDRMGLHHIDYDKKNCKPENIITVCVSCNSRANGSKDFPRQYWQQMYEGIMISKYGE